MISRTTLMSASDPAAASSREKEIFMAALDVDDPAAQAAYLDSACAGDADLRARVERLLGLEADSRSFLQPPSMMRKGVEALEEPDFDATIQLASKARRDAQPEAFSKSLISMPRSNSPPPHCRGRSCHRLSLPRRRILTRPCRLFSAGASPRAAWGRSWRPAIANWAAPSR